jgi:small multidrug resistance pump
MMGGLENRRITMAYLYLLVAIVAEVIATSALKASDGFSRVGPVVLVVAGYGVAFYMLSLTLRTIAYAMWSGLGIVLISIASRVLFGQKLDAAAMLGMALIIAGVLVMNLWSKSSAH